MSITINEKIKELIIYTFKGLLYVSCFTVFVLIFDNLNGAITDLTRTSVITTFVFCLSLLLMVPVYGNFEIGRSKSKPVIYSTLVQILFTDIAAFLVLGIMGINQIPLSAFFPKGLILFLPMFFIQMVVIIVAAYFGNYIFFKLYEPESTMIIHNDELMKKKIEKYILSHKKQYRLVETIQTDNSHADVNLSGIDTIFLLGLRKGFRNDMIENSFFNYQNLFFNADIYDVMSGKDRLTVYDDVLMVSYNKEKITLVQSFIKRLFDIFISLVFLVIFIPVFVIIGLAIKIDDGGPIFYRQERLTRDGDVFKIIKFRSMKLNSGNQPAKMNDDRITKTGKFIRAIRVDEIPQFINILKGDMSMVGPRPESSEIMDQIMETLPEFRYRLKVKAGLTGYAQIFGKYNTSPKQKLLMDLKYIETYSLKSDLKLMFQTVNIFFKSDSTEGF